mgnify:CR=1 FL=1
MHHNVPTSAGTILNGSLYVGACTCFPGSLLEILWSVSYCHLKLCAVLPVFTTDIICSTETFKVTIHALIFRIELKVHTLICQYGWVVHKYLVTIIPTIWSIHVLLAGTCNLNIQNIIIINVLHCGPALEVPTVPTRIMERTKCSPITIPWVMLSYVVNCQHGNSWYDNAPTMFRLTNIQHYTHTLPIPQRP